MTTPSAAPSPFARVRSLDDAELPPVFRTQFLEPLRPGQRIVLNGAMREIWHRPTWITPFLWLSSRFDMLFAETGKDIPVRLVISAAKSRAAHSAQRWQRTFRFKRARRFSSLVLYDDRHCGIVERLGPAGIFETEWIVRFLPPDRLEIRSTAAFLRIAAARLPLPRLLAGEIHAVQQAVKNSPDSVSIEFSINHPLLGPVFGYNGYFQVSSAGQDQ